jgi:hypothetical protein
LWGMKPSDEQQAGIAWNKLSNKHNISGSFIPKKK